MVSTLSLRFVPALVLLCLLIPWLTYSVIKALRTGVANTHNVLYRRAKRPFMFWSTVLLQIGIILFFSYGLYRWLRM